MLDLHRATCKSHQAESSVSFVTGVTSSGPRVSSTRRAELPVGKTLALHRNERLDDGDVLDELVAEAVALSQVGWRVVRE